MYAMEILHGKYPVHLYYGKNSSRADLKFHHTSKPFCHYPESVGNVYSPDSDPVEYPFFGNGDFRPTALRLLDMETGSDVTDFTFKKARRIKGRVDIAGVPCGEADENTETLELLMTDAVSGCELRLYYTLFGDCDVIERSLDLVRDETPRGEWMNHISTYSLWWVMVHCDLYRSTGNKEYLSKQREKLCEILERAIGFVDESGSEMMPEKRLLDWPNEANEGAKHAGIHALLKMTLEKGAVILREIGEEALAEKCERTAERMRKHIPDPCGSKQAAALLALSGLGDARRLNDEVISVGGARNFSTFFSYYLLAAKAMAGDGVGALETLREYYGGMLKMGATTFWEDFDLEWMENSAPIDEIVPEGKNDIHGDYGAYCYKNYRHSLCHGWASGPCPYLSNYVLGVRAVDATTYEIKPDLADLDWVKGSYPTVKGVITVCAEKTAEGVKVEYTAPEGIKIITK
jgi:hypothetical protein